MKKSKSKPKTFRKTKKQLKRVKKVTKSHLRRVKKETTAFVMKVRRNVATAILAAFAFVMALVWRDAIQEGVNKFISVFNISEEGYLFSIIAALFVTIVCVIGVFIFSRWAEKK